MAFEGEPGNFARVNLTYLVIRCRFTSSVLGIQSGEASSLPSEFCPTSDLRRQKKTFPAVNIRGGNFGRRTPKTLWLAQAPLNLLDTLDVRPNYRTSSMSLGPGQLEGCLVYRVDSMISQHSPTRSAEERLRGRVR